MRRLGSARALGAGRAPDAAATRARLLDPRTLARYDGLGLRVRRGMGSRPGDRRFPGHPQASGVEVEAHGVYAPGDDLRHLDWNAVGRLDALLVRRFTAEREVVFHLLIDASASMGVPPADAKLATALEVAMALAYVALIANDAVRVTVLGGPTSPVFRQRASALEVATRLAETRPAGALALGDALGDHARRHPRPGVAIVVSDFMLEPRELEAGLHALAARRYALLLVHVLGAREVDPAAHFSRGVLQDPESGATHPIALTPAVRARYAELLADHLAALAALAARVEARYARITTDTSVPTFVTGELARLGVVRRR